MKSGKWFMVFMVAVGLLCCTLSVQAGTLAYWELDDVAPGGSLLDGARVIDSSGMGRDMLISAPSGNPFEFWDGDPGYGLDSSAVHMVSRTAAGAGLIYSAGHDFGDGGAVSAGYFEMPLESTILFEMVIRIPVSAGTAQQGLMEIQSQNVDGGSNVDQVWWRTESKDVGGGVMKNVQVLYFKADGRGIWNHGLTELHDGQWHHIAAAKIHNGGNDVALMLYTDGVLEDGRGNGGAWQHFGDCTNAADIYFGSWATDKDMTGNIDFIKITEFPAGGPITVDDLVKARQTASSPVPADGAIGQAVSLNLNWTPVTGTINDQTVTVATDPEFNNVIQSYTNVVGGSVSLSGLDQSATYYWAVDTDYTDPNGTYFEVGPTWRFSTVEANGSVAGHWKFDDANPGSVIVDGDKILDSSGNNRNLYVLNEDAGQDALYGNPAAAYGSTASFEGVNDCQLVLEPGHDFGDAGPLAGSAINFLAGEDFTIEAVVKIDAENTETNGIISYIPDVDSIYWYTSNQSNYWLRVNPDGDVYFYYRSDGEVTGLGSTALVNDSQWHHIAVVRDTTAGTMSLYIDYALENSVTDNVTNDMFPRGKMVVAGFNEAYTRNFGGNLDFVKVSRSALAPGAFEQPAYVLPTDPNPADGATGVAAETMLSWTAAAGVGVLGETVVIADDPYMANVIETIPATGGSMVDPASLVYDVTYYWRVDTQIAGGTYAGEIWSFGTPECLVKPEDGNLNGDCIVDMQDFVIMSGNWLASEYAE